MATCRPISKVVRGTLTELAEYVAETCESADISRFRFPLFRPFNAVIHLGSDQLLLVSSPLAGGIADIYWIHEPSEEAGDAATFALAISEQLGWQDITVIAVPVELVVVTTEQREAGLRAIAAGLVDEFARESHRGVSLRPIFRTRPEDIELDEALCFVLMPFAPSFDRLYRDVIAPAVEAGGLKPLRADEIFTTTAIVEEIWKHIASARLIIADVSSKNPNVFYELGLAHAVGKPVIVLTQAATDVPFDIAYIRYFLYRDDATGWAALAMDLQKAIGSALADTAGGLTRPR